MNKKVLIIITALFILIATILYFALKFNAQSRKTQNLVKESNYEGSFKKEVIDNDKIKISTEKGELSVNNFYTKGQVKYDNEANPVEILLSQTEQYKISYVYDGDFFDIVILKNPIISSRNLAEFELLSILEIKKEDACKLRTILSVPSKVNQELGGDDQLNYGLSWCPGAYNIIEE